jgi:lysozyme
MRKGILITLVGVLAILGPPSFLYLSGWWIPNEPDSLRYPIHGLDVSAHQGFIDWKKVSASGIRFVYLKATEGGDFQDADFDRNLKAAHEAGLACGAYHFFSLRAPGTIQAQHFIRTVPRAEMNLPPAIDLEFWGNSAARPSPATFQADLNAYMNAVRVAYDHEPVIYTSPDFSKTYLQGFPVVSWWIRAVLFSPGNNDKWLLWQFSEKGRVPGITGFVDLDVYQGPDLPRP